MRRTFVAVDVCILDDYGPAIERDASRYANDMAREKFFRYGERIWWFTGRHCEGRVLLKKARRKGFRGCIQSVVGGGSWQDGLTISSTRKVMGLNQILYSCLLSWVPATVVSPG
ncbi:hypothetical protein KCU85_g49, partial [Aureobasidium melanogenum]